MTNEEGDRWPEREMVWMMNLEYHARIDHAATMPLLQDDDPSS